MNLLQNGAFDGNLNWWTGDGTIDRSLGYPRLGCVALAAGQSVESEALGLAENQLYTVHYFYRLATGVTLTVGIGGVSTTHTGTPLSVWREGVLAFALDDGVDDGVSLSVAGGACYVDTVTLMVGGLAIDRAGIATIVAARLGTLATDASLSATASASGPNGDYSLAIDDALRAVGATSLYGDPDVTLLTPAQIDDVVQAARNTMLQTVRATYALTTDIQLGPRRESRSQTATSIDAMLSGGSGGSQRVQMGNLEHAEWRR